MGAVYTVDPTLADLARLTIAPGYDLAKWTTPATSGFSLTRQGDAAGWSVDYELANTFITLSAPLMNMVEARDPPLGEMLARSGELGAVRYALNGPWALLRADCQTFNFDEDAFIHLHQAMWRELDTAIARWHLTAPPEEERVVIAAAIEPLLREAAFVWQRREAQVWSCAGGQFSIEVDDDGELSIIAPLVDAERLDAKLVTDCLFANHELATFKLGVVARTGQLSLLYCFPLALVHDDYFAFLVGEFPQTLAFVREQFPELPSRIEPETG